MDGDRTLTSQQQLRQVLHIVWRTAEDHAIGPFSGKGPAQHRQPLLMVGGQRRYLMIRVMAIVGVGQCAQLLVAGPGIADQQYPTLRQLADRTQQGPQQLGGELDGHGNAVAQAWALFGCEPSESAK